MQSKNFGMEGENSESFSQQILMTRKQEKEELDTWKNKGNPLVLNFGICRNAPLMR
jgi:hypothetical protein